MPLTQSAEAVGGFGSFDSPAPRPGGATALGGRVSLAREDDGSDMSTSGKAAGSAPGRTARAHPSAMDVRIAASPDLPVELPSGLVPAPITASGTPAPARRPMTANAPQAAGMQSLREAEPRGAQPAATVAKSETAKAPGGSDSAPEAPAGDPEQPPSGVPDLLMRPFLDA